MPQFDPALFAPQVFWLLIAFGGLWLVLSRVALPRIERTMVERAEQIESDLDAARSMRAEAQTIADAQAALLAEARSRAAATAERTKAEIRARFEKKLGILDAELESRIAEAEAHIRAETEAALAGLAPIAAEVASEVVATLAGRAVTPSRIEKAVSRATQEVSL
ncbi:MAG: ATP synthase subunit b 2 [Rhodothalassiaceae bacterium]